MLKYIDDLLNRVTMYRLVLYYVTGLWLAAFILSFFKLLPYTPLEFFISAALIVGVCLSVNSIFARVFGAPTNLESVYATAFILILIVPPMRSAGLLPFLAWAALWAMASKYIFAIWKKHIFNPAAFAVGLTALTLNRSANWWVSSVYLLPFVVIGGLLVVRKIQRFDLVISFLVVAFFSISGFSFLKGADPLSVVEKIMLYSPLLFFGFAMLTEPSGTPPTRKLRIMYGALVGLLFNPNAHIGSFYFTPEFALLTGNIFSYLVSPKQKLVLRLREKISSAKDVYDFWFTSDKKMNFKAGQYMEWTLGHESQDKRGIRRYLTICSSPTEKDIMVGVKFPPNSSSFKQSMISLKKGDTIVVSQLAGEFVLPRDASKKLVFIAGGIGVTPFRSMVKYLLDKKEQRDIVLLYCNHTPDDVAYKDIFDEAKAVLGMKTVYTITDEPFPKNWKGATGFVDEAMIKKAVPDYKERMFYISGTHAMVVAFVEILQKMGVRKKQIIQDFFPGF